MSAITEAEDEIKAIAWNDMVKSKTREKELLAENLALHEQVAFLQSPEVCAAAHEDVSDCGYCQRDRLRAGIKRIIDGYGGDVQAFCRNLLAGKA